MKKKILSIAIVLGMLCQLICCFGVVAANGEYVPNAGDIKWSADFEGYDGSTLPSGMGLKGSGVSVSAYNNAIKLDLADASSVNVFDAPGLRVSVPRVSEDLTVVSTDIYFDEIDASNNTNPDSKSLFKTNVRGLAAGDIWWASGNWYINDENICFNQDMTVGREKTSFAKDTWYTYKVCINFLNGTYSSYLVDKTAGTVACLTSDAKFTATVNNVAVIDFGVCCVSSIILDNITVYREPYVHLKSPVNGAVVSKTQNFTLSAQAPAGFTSLGFEVDGVSVGNAITSSNDDALYDMPLGAMSAYAAGMHTAKVTAVYPEGIKEDICTFIVADDSGRRNITPSNAEVADFNGLTAGSDLTGMYLDLGENPIRGYMNSPASATAVWRNESANDVAIRLNAGSVSDSGGALIIAYAGGNTSKITEADDVKVLEFDAKLAQTTDRLAIGAHSGVALNYTQYGSTSIGAIFNADGKIYGSTVDYKANEWMHVSIMMERRTGMAEVFVDGKFINRTPFDVSLFNVTEQQMDIGFNMLGITNADANADIDNFSYYTLKRPISFMSLNYTDMYGNNVAFTENGQEIASVKSVSFSANFTPEASDIKLLRKNGQEVPSKVTENGGVFTVAPIGVLRSGEFTVSVASGNDALTASFVIPGTSAAIISPAMNQVVATVSPFNISALAPDEFNTAEIYLDGVLKTTVTETDINGTVSYKIEGEELAALGAGSHMAKTVFKTPGGNIEDAVTFFIKSVRNVGTHLAVNFDDTPVGTSNPYMAYFNNCFMTDSKDPSFGTIVFRDSENGNALKMTHSTITGPDGYGDHFYTYLREGYVDPNHDILTLDFDINPKYTDSALMLQGPSIAEYNAEFPYYQILQNNGMVCGNTVPYKAGEWQHIKLVFDVYKGKVSVYYNDTLAAYTNYNKDGLGCMRFGFWDTVHTDAEYLIDNIVFGGYCYNLYLTDAVYTRTDGSTASQSELYNLAEISDLASVKLVASADVSSLLTNSDVALYKIRNSGDSEIVSDIAVNANEITVTPTLSLSQGNYYVKAKLSNGQEMRVDFTVADFLALEVYENAVVTYNTGIAKDAVMFKAFYTNGGRELLDVEKTDIMLPAGESVLTTIPELNGADFANIFIWKTDISPLTDVIRVDK